MYVRLVRRTKRPQYQNMEHEAPHPLLVFSYPWHKNMVTIVTRERLNVLDK